MRIFSLGLLFLGLSEIIIGQTVFEEVTQQSGIEHHFEVFEGLFGGGGCAADFNNDGWEDLYIAGGMHPDRLYINQQDGTFKDFLASSGLVITSKYVTQGAISADFNKDGWVDLLVTTITRADTILTIPRAINLLFINKGDGTFYDATRDFGLDEVEAFSTSAHVGDINADGFPDLYVGNYFYNYDGKLDTIYDNDIVNANNEAEDFLYINQKGLKFERQDKKYGIKHTGFGFGGVFTDTDNDGNLDIIVMNDFGYKAPPNLLYINEFPKKRFTEKAEELEMDLKINSMGIAIGDITGDGYLDYFFTNIRGNYLMVRTENGYEDIAEDLKLKFFNISWGANFSDFDNDGDLDLFSSNGDLNPNCTPMYNHYYENQGGKFSEKARLVGLADYGMGRGSIVFDKDNDGDLDLLVINHEPILPYPEGIHSVTKLYENKSTNDHHWLKVQLKGIENTTRGLGARIVLHTSGGSMIREIDGGSSFISQSSSIAHFGLGAIDSIDYLEIVWPGNRIQRIDQISIDTTLLVEEEIHTLSKNWFRPSYLLILLILFGLFFILKKKNK
jgi:hypothetical protein